MENPIREPKINFKIIWQLMNVVSLAAGLISDFTSFASILDSKPTSEFFRKIQVKLERTAYKKMYPNS